MWNKMFIQKSSVQQKMLIAFACLVLFPLGLFSYISLAITKQTIEEQVVAEKSKSLRSISQKLEIMASDLTAISNIYFSNEDLRVLLLSNPGDQAYQERVKKQFLTKMIVSYRYAYTWLDYYTSIIGFNGIELHTFYDGPKIGVDALKKEPWYPEVLRLDGGVLWYSDPSVKMRATVNEDHYISAMRLIKDFENNTTIGLMLINIGESFLYKQYEDVLQEQESMLIFDNQGKIVSATDKAKVGGNIGTYPYYERFSDQGEHFKIKIDGTDMLVTHRVMGSTGWTIVCYTPMDMLLKNVDKMKWLNIFLLGAVLILSFIVSYIIARRLSVPIRKLFASMKKVEMGDLRERSDVSGNDEIGELAKRFNQMITRIEELHGLVIEEQEMKRKVELQNLQSQINTHFLYNTLASIRSMLVTHPPEMIDSVVVSLVKLLKKSLSAESEYITIAEELDNLKHYVNIQSARQDGKLSVEFDVDERILHYKTLKLLLQPLVENAIFHGIEPKGEAGFIRIRGWAEHDCICFTVADNGVGFDAGLVSADPAENALPASGGLGLANVKHRMQLHFGTECGIEIVIPPDGGTMVMVRWPMFMRVEELKRQ
ncbi:Histidine kinase-, DNA gyrase B-, and HSP90-like ATPase [Paenibacillus sp. UNCCL117]|uniref:cache domain-containing sensor histidine kinase n=1 Tax=unclassified Paenibacillus TaxID=185978 RepID=UPI00088A9DEC|nr:MULTISPECIES: sensor histidine kinase [unclassified Paenibacillus]SDE07465.1 Histidine kinase-, DNA gyrase B-, and HSP90-like ATPase [Paenibacillus sp. cl123]SFW59165.1 Histidine kinase-, DNA gyrase B-, and HSP90-like ATPase [Paenibacillus sp. UNCCL117]